MSDYSELKRLAEAATPGKWSSCGSYLAPTREENGTTYVESWRSIAMVPADNDRQFIAAANPAAVLALIAENERLKRDAECAEAKQAHAEMIGDGFYHASEKLKAEIESLRKALIAIRDNSSSLWACETAADALVDSRK